MAPSGSRISCTQLLNSLPLTHGCRAKGGANQTAPRVVAVPPLQALRQRIPQAPAGRRGGADTGSEIRRCDLHRMLGLHWRRSVRCSVPLARDAPRKRPPPGQLTRARPCTPPA